MKPKTFKTNWLLIILLTIFLPVTGSSQTVTWGNQTFRIDTLADHLGFPWEVTYGPDDSLWVTEARGYKVTKIHARNGGISKGRPDHVRAGGIVDLCRGGGDFQDHAVPQGQRIRP